MSAATYRALSKRLREHVNASAGSTRAWCIPGEGFGGSYYNVLMRNGTQTTLSLRGKARRESHDSLQTIRGRINATRKATSAKGWST